jgi:two-component system alkaline phosphatase synthesis response regulator PhoP
VTRVLIIEDNTKLLLGLKANLEFEGYETFTAEDGASGIAAARSCEPDLVILDLMLPDTDGLRVLEQLRESGSTVPVLVLTALGEETDKVRGFRAGADDYVTKPFGLMELLARVDALLRRARTGQHPVPQARYTIGEIVIDVATHEVTRRGTAVSLRPKEFELLVALASREGAAASRLELLQEVWGYDEAVVSRTVDTHVAELRRKLEDDPAVPKHLLTVRKTGYRLVAE